MAQDLIILRGKFLDLMGATQIHDLTFKDPETSDYVRGGYFNKTLSEITDEDIRRILNNQEEVSCRDFMSLIPVMMYFLANRNSTLFEDEFENFEGFQYPSAYSCLEPSSMSMVEVRVEVLEKLGPHVRMWLKEVTVCISREISEQKLKYPNTEDGNAMRALTTARLLKCFEILYWLAEYETIASRDLA